MFQRVIDLLSGKQKINLIDVGSAASLPSPWRENVAQIRNLLKFEPRERSKKVKHTVTLDIALWNENCVKDFHIYKGRGGTGSSFYLQNYDYVKEHFEDLRTRGPSNLAETWFER